MVARIIHCFGSGVCEALPVQLVNDIFFLHERGKYLGFYTCEPRPALSITNLGRVNTQLTRTRRSLLQPHRDIAGCVHPVHGA